MRIWTPFCVILKPTLIDPVINCLISLFWVPAYFPVCLWCFGYISPMCSFPNSYFSYLCMSFLSNFIINSLMTSTFLHLLCFMESSLCKCSIYCWMKPVSSLRKIYIRNESRCLVWREILDFLINLWFFLICFIISPLNIIQDVTWA